MASNWRCISMKIISWRQEMASLYSQPIHFTKRCMPSGFLSTSFRLVLIDFEWKSITIFHEKTRLVDSTTYKIPIWSLAFYFLIPHILWDSMSITLLFQSLLELPLHLLQISIQMVLSSIYEEGFQDFIIYDRTTPPLCNTRMIVSSLLVLKNRKKDENKEQFHLHFQICEISGRPPTFSHETLVIMSSSFLGYLFHP